MKTIGPFSCFVELTDNHGIGDVFSFLRIAFDHAGEVSRTLPTQITTRTVRRS